MSHESDLVMPLPPQMEKAIIMPVLDPMHHPPLEHSPNESEIRAAEAVFAAKERESAAVAGLLSLWTGTMLVNDLAMETFSEPGGEKPDVQKQKDEED